MLLLHFARAWALLISKLSEADALRSATASPNAIISELPLHLAYCQQWGISEALMAIESEAVETLNYTRYVLDATARRQSDLCFAALFILVVMKLAIWLTTVLLLRRRASLDRARYQAYEQFLFHNKLIKSITPVKRYATGSE